MPDLYIDSNATGAGDGSSWADAYTTIALALSDATDPISANDEVWIASDYYESETGLDRNFTFPDAVTLSSVNSSTDQYEAGAEYILTGNYTLSIYGQIDSYLYISGVEFTSNEQIRFNYGVIIEDGVLTLTSASTDAIVPVADGSNYQFINTDVVFQDGETHYLQLASGSRVRWKSGTLTGNPNYFIYSYGNAGGRADIENVDLTSITTGALVRAGNVSQDNYIINFTRCKINKTTPRLNSTDIELDSCEVNLSSCDAGTGYHYFEYLRYLGAVSENTTVYRVGGSYYKEGAPTTSNFSAQFAPNNNVAEYTRPLEIKIVDLELDLTSVNTLTFQLAFGDDSSAITTFTNAEAWIKLVQNDSTDTALGVVTESKPATITTTPTDLTSSSETWTGLTHTNTDKREIAIDTTVVSGMTNGQVTAYLCIAKYVSTLEIFGCAKPDVT